MDLAGVGSLTQGISSGLGAIGNLVFSGLNYSAQQKQQKFQNELALEQMRRADDWNKNQTQYKVQDAINAGVNPLSVLGNQGFNPTPSGSQSAAQFDTSAFNNMERIGASAAQVGNQILESDLIRSQKNVADAQAVKLLSEANSIDNYQNPHIQQQIDNLLAQKDYMQNLSDQVLLQNDVLENDLIYAAARGLPVYGNLDPFETWEIKALEAGLGVLGTVLGQLGKTFIFKKFGFHSIGEIIKAGKDGFSRKIQEAIVDEVKSKIFRRGRRK